ncbi:MAG: CRISPR system precrRNA processing endoribonuclease RAMP protein Cas6 [Desulfovibrio sp.]|nr:CRISPR system precrRNA processing endoribonuclease RAMP protein Cas6 [Desulfovibrio sp.]
MDSPSGHAGDSPGRKPQNPEAVRPVARYRLSFEVQTPVCLPDYAGSMLRGVFGQALRAIACMTREKQCPPCPLYASCPYSLLFETPPPLEHPLQKFNSVPSPYIVEPPSWGRRVYKAGETLSFHMVLFGRALDKLALVIYAWQKAFARSVGHGTAALTDVYLVTPEDDICVYDCRNRRIFPHNTTLTLPAACGRDFTLLFSTPLRLQENKRILPPEHLTPRVLLTALARRSSLLAEFHAGIAPHYNFQTMVASTADVPYAHDLQWRRWARYSNRQRQSMPMDGVVGWWRLRNVPEHFHELLYLGQWTHVGKNATFGLGHYRLEEVQA